MFFPTDVAQTFYGLFPAIFVVYFICKVYMFSKLAVVILLLFCSFSVAQVVVVVVVVCFPGVTTHCGCIFQSPVAVFSLLVFEVS
jgi:hypothetical protein